MLADKRVLAVVPARGGSKGVRLKNIHPLAGVPLLTHTARLLEEQTWVDRRVVSTDSDAIADVAARNHLGAPFRRPESLSGDRIGDFEVLEHALL
jgi:CMP-N-acetylneuraminic acid synthetase